MHTIKAGGLERDYRREHACNVANGALEMKLIFDSSIVGSVECMLLLASLYVQYSLYRVKF
jgi:hypothetical protein